DMKKSRIDKIYCFYFIGNFFSISNELKTIDFIYSALFHVPLVWLVYVNLKFNIPKYLEKGKYVFFILLSCTDVFIAFLLHHLIFDILIVAVSSEFYIVSFTDNFVLGTIFGSYLAITTLLKLSKSWYQLQQSEKERLSFELNSLKMQVNPHFLFNSLNSIYSLSLKKSDQAPEVILKLSNLLRYMLYEVSEEQVALSKEISSLEDYLNLQRVRVGDDIKINFKVDEQTKGLKIAPLLFFPLVENSFKHGLKADKENYVDAALTTKANTITFRIKNTKGKADEPEKGTYGGIGLENVKKRLQLIYKSNASLTISEDDDTFEAILKINTDV
ncbi:MAG: histidine kinase, partial [Bacteroidota bacterium]